MMEPNRFLQKDVAGGMRHDRKRKFPLKFACQVGVAPPTFVLFLRGSRKLHFSMVRFLMNQMRGHYSFFATPIRLLQRTGSKQKR